ncbi:MAG: hypothetical protein V4581_13860 [Bacteroidota bacterium]
MKIITILRNGALALLLLCVGCSAEPDFLKQFRGPLVKRKLYIKQISPRDVNILLATNEVNQSLSNIDHTYYYGFYKQLDDKHYLISYQDKYTPAYRFTNNLIGWNDIYYCIYNRNTNAVVSKLKVQSTDPVSSYFEEKDDIYTIKSRYFKFVPVEAPCSIKIQNDSAISKYRIENNRFVQL